MLMRNNYNKKLLLFMPFTITSVHLRENVKLVELIFL